MANETSLALNEIDPRNVLALITPLMRSRAIEVFEKHPEWQKLVEYELERLCNPSMNATLIRVAFWEEYQRAQDHNKRMMMSKIYDGVMSKDGFLDFLDKDENIAWMMCPPANEFLQMKADSYRARQEYSKILRSSLIYEKTDIDKGEVKGQVNIKLSKLHLEIYKLYSDRIHGSVVQKIEKKVQNIPANDIGGDPEQLIKELEELRSKQADALAVIDVSKEEVNE